MGPTGITSSTGLAANTSYLTNLQYDNGEIYLSNGQVLNASGGALNGTFYATGNTPASGPVVSDSTLGRAFIAVSSFSGSSEIYVFDESSYNVVGSIPVNNLGTAGYPTSSSARSCGGARTGLPCQQFPVPLRPITRIYIFQSPLVKDVSSSPADLSATLTAPATTTTGTAITYTLQVTNAGPNAAVGATLATSLDPSLIINSITASTGSCTTGATFTCDLGGLPSGGGATVTVNATPTTAGTLSATTSVSSSSYDPTASNNQSTGSTTVTGSLYGAVPSIASIAPSLVQAGSAAFTLTVTGTGFNACSVVNLGTTALATAYVSATQLTAAVTAGDIATYGWAPVTVSNPTPGGGVSSIAPPSRSYDLVSVTPNAILFDP